MVKSSVRIERGTLPSEATITSWLGEMRRLSGDELTWDDLVLELDYGEWRLAVRCGDQVFTTAFPSPDPEAHRGDTAEFFEDEVLRFGNEILEGARATRRFAFLEESADPDGDAPIWRLVLVTTAEAMALESQFDAFLQPDPWPDRDDELDDDDPPEYPDAKPPSIGVVVRCLPSEWSDEVHALAFIDDVLAIADGDALRIVDPATGAERARLDLPARVLAVSGGTLFAGTDSGCVYAIEVDGWRPRRSRLVAPLPIAALVAADGVVRVSWDGRELVLDPETLADTGRAPIAREPRDERINDAVHAVTPTGTILVASVDELREVDAAGEEVAGIVRPYDFAITAIAVTEAWLAVMDDGGLVWIAPYAEVTRLPLDDDWPPEQPPSGVVVRVRDAARCHLAVFGDHVAVVDDESLQVWDAPTGDSIAQLPIAACVVGTDDRHLFVGDRAGVVYRLDPRTFEVERSRQVAVDWIHSLTFAGEAILVGAGDDLIVVARDDLSEIRRIPARQVWRPVLLGEGRAIGIGRNLDRHDVLVVLDLVGGAELARVQPGQFIVLGATVSGDRSRVAVTTCSWQDGALLDAAALTVVAPLPRAVASAWIGDTLLFGSSEHIIVADRSGTELQRLTPFQHAGHISRIATSPDGTWLAVVFDNGKLWITRDPLSAARSVGKIR